MYEDAGNVEQSLIDDLLLVVEQADWVHYLDSSKDYWTWHPKDLPELPFKRVESPFFLKIAPKGKVHKHVDNEKPYVTYHIPIMTNSECWCFSTEDNTTITKHLKLGQQYIAHRTCPHWSCNDGESDRIHLLVPVYAD